MNDAITLKITITGNGNLKIASPPVLKLSPDIEVYDPKIADDLKNGAKRNKRSKKFRIPDDTKTLRGTVTIPPVTYS